MNFPLDALEACWHGAISLEKTAEYVRPWRIPFQDRALFPPAMLAAASTQAGVRLAFDSDTCRVAGEIVPLEGNQKLELFVNGCLVETVDLSGKDFFAFEGLEAGEKRLELWLPQRGDFALKRFEIDDNATLRPFEDSRPRWVTYGSSITHCRAASSPSRTWPGIVAQTQNWNHTNLGYGGQCHLDPQMARLIRDLPADYLSICAGINIYSGPSLNQRSFRPALIGTIQIIREKHPTTPLLVISPIYSHPRETNPNSQGWTLPDYRAAVEEAVETLRAHGDENVHYLSGLKIAGEECDPLMPDRLHPDAEGCEVMAQNFLRYAVPILTGS